MAGKKSDLGPTGTTVADNVGRVRTGRNLTYAELSRRLHDNGREIPPLGLRRIESGERRVDADDLVALAAALKISPTTLLMPHGVNRDTPAEVSGVHDAISAGTLWAWLNAESELPGWAPGAFIDDARPSWENAEMERILGPERMAALMKLRASKAYGDGNDQ